MKVKRCTSIQCVRVSSTKNGDTLKMKDTLLMPRMSKDYGVHIAEMINYGHRSLDPLSVISNPVEPLHDPVEVAALLISKTHLSERNLLCSHRIIHADLSLLRMFLSDAIAFLRGRMYHIIPEKAVHIPGWGRVQ